VYAFNLSVFREEIKNEPEEKIRFIQIHRRARFVGHNSLSYSFVLGLLLSNSSAVGPHAFEKTCITFMYNKLEGSMVEEVLIKNYDVK
jgi:hypothetical protein